MKQVTGRMMGLLLLMVLFSLRGISQKTMTWSSKSKASKELTKSAANHMMNVEFEQAYADLSAALKLDPDNVGALALMANVSRGETRKAYSERAMKAAENRSEGERLFASLTNSKNTQEENRATWAKLQMMYPDDPFIGDLYVQTRATPDERFAAAQEYIKKFPNQPSMYNTIAYYYMNDKKDNAMAKQNFEKYISLYPDGANPYDSMGEYYLNTGDMENSKKYYNMALERYPYMNSSLNALQKMADSKKAASASTQ